MYIGYNTIYTVYGKLFGDTLLIDTCKFPIKQKFNKKTKTGFIQFIREPNGVCNILHIVEHEL